MPSDLKARQPLRVRRLVYFYFVERRVRSEVLNFGETLMLLLLSNALFSHIRLHAIKTPCGRSIWYDKFSPGIPSNRFQRHDL